MTSQNNAPDVDYRIRDLNCRNLSAASISGMTRSMLAQDALAEFVVPINLLRVWDAPHTPLGNTPGTDDLGIIYNTFLTLPPTVESGDLKAAGSTTRKLGFQIWLPPEYEAGQTIVLRSNAGMKTTVADVAATIDFQAARQADPTTDLVTTAASTINSLTAGDDDFALTVTSCVPGDALDVVVSLLVNDAATATAVIGRLNKLSYLLDIKG